ncbi:HIT family protein [Ktedonobacteria bacterium brp13]|nr:HIT family protein [Ktedonobacteria bacterium brp13]
MQRRSDASTSARVNYADCPFCQFDTVTDYILQESPHFLIVADHAPILEGHLLIIPREHYACYGDVPAALDEELRLLKAQVQHFFELQYASPLYWEHGVFHQTVFHAHLHCFPFGHIRYQPGELYPGQLIHNQNDIRTWYQERGHYFFMDDTEHGYIFPPDAQYYFHIMKEVLAPGIAANGKSFPWSPSELRQLEGRPLVATLIARWQQFQELL